MATRTCWNCERDAHQTLIGSPIRSKGHDREALHWFVLGRCDQCGYGSMAEVVAVAEQLRRDHDNGYGGWDLTPTSAEDALSSKMVDAIELLDGGEKVTWHPAHARGRKFDDVPPPIDSAAAEAWACFGVGLYRAAAIMARAVVEATAKEQGATKRHLVEKIDELKTKDIISTGVKDAAHEIRYIGNDMAHGDFATATIDQEMCESVLTFMSELLIEVYQRPARLAKSKAARQRTAPPAPQK